MEKSFLDAQGPMPGQRPIDEVMGGRGRPGDDPPPPPYDAVVMIDADEPGKAMVTLYDGYTMVIQITWNGCWSLTVIYS